MAPATWREQAAAEPQLTEADFTAIARLVRETAGIVLGNGKRELVYSRLRRRLRALNLDSFLAYRALLEGPDGLEERERMVNAITTNLTSFFRESHHFQHLAEIVLPHLSQRERRLRVWSAGCSTGEEAYSMALTVERSLPARESWDARILATDIDTDVLASAAAGQYPASRLEGIPTQYASLLPPAAPDGMVTLPPAIRRLVTFKHLNLLEAWPMRGPFDAIFCRNVVIYFDKQTQRSLFDRFANLLRPGGYLYVGHSESLYRCCDRFTHAGRTIYRKL